MAERVVKVRLSAEVASYQKALRDASKATRDTGTEVEKLAQKRQAFDTIGRAALGMGATISVGIGVAVKKFVDFDKQMSAVQAATHETAASMNMLRDAALEAGARTVFSATEAAAAIEELSKAGVSTADILSGGLDASLDLAAAGGLAVADAAGIAATALKTFNLQGNDMSHVADLLAAGAGKAMGDVTDLAQALSQGGQVAKQTGLSIEETTAGLSAFAAQGLLGSDAGTSFKSMLQRLTPQSNESAKLMEQLGVNAYDAAGNFVGLAEFAGNLQTALADLTPEQRNSAMATIFGSDAVRAASVLYTEGEAGIRNWISAVNDQGYAAETAAMRLDNLAGDWEKLTGALDTAFITMGEGANGPLRMLVQTLTGFVDNFSEMPTWAQQTSLGLAGLTTAVAAGGGAFLLAIPKIQEYRDSIALMGTNAQRAGRVLGALGKTAGVAAGLMAVAVAGSAVADAMGMAGGEAKSFEATLKSLLEQEYDAPFNDISSEVTGLASAFDLLFSDDFNAAGERFGSDLNSLFGGALPDQVRETREQFATMGEALAQMVESGDGGRAAAVFAEIADAAEEQGYSVEQVRDLMPGYQDALDGVSNSSELAAGAAEETATGIDGLAEAAEEAESNLDALKEILDSIGGTARDMGAAQDAATAAINALTAAAAAGEVTMDGTNSASLGMRDAIRSAEEAARDAAVAMIENGVSADDAAAAYRRNRDAILDQIQPYFASRDAAAAWADENLGSAQEVEGGLRNVADAVNAIPRNVTTSVNLNGASDAEQKLRSLKAWADSIPSVKRVTLETITIGGPTPGGRTISADGSANGNLYDQRRALAFANGGFPSGIYRGGPPIYKFAEPETRWEAFISGKPGQEKRNQAIAAEAVERLGGVAEFADGGLAAAQSEVRFQEGRVRSWMRSLADRKRRRDATARDSDARKAAEATVKAHQRGLEEARADLERAREAVSNVRGGFRDDLSDWNTGLRRGEQRSDGTGGNGLSLVDKAFSTATDLGGKAGAALRRTALTTEKAYLSLEKKAEKAAASIEAAQDRADARREKADDRADAALKKAQDRADVLLDRAEDAAARRIDKVTTKWNAAIDKAATKLDNLRSASSNMASAIASSISGILDLGALGTPGTKTVTDTKRTSQTIGGVKVATLFESTREVDVPVTAGSIRAGIRADATAVGQFASRLQQLAKKGISSALLADIANLGPEQGLPIVDALLKATAL